MAGRKRGDVALSGRSAFAIGVAGALSAGVLGPYIGRHARPWLLSAFKVGLDVGERVRVRSAELVEDVEDLAAEAQRLRGQTAGRGAARGEGETAPGDR